jgi:hypothetical protein
MKRYGLIENGKIIKTGELPVNFKNVSNFYCLSEEEIRKFGWLPIETISDNKEIQERVDYKIEKNVIKEIIITRDKTIEEIERVNQTHIDSKWHSVRIERDNLLKESDIEIVADKWDAMDQKTKSLWALYRKKLRDIPTTYSNPDEVVWPQKP